MPQYQPRIAIVGGGPSGMTVALLLHRRNIPFTVFELRGKPTPEDLARPVGMLDLHEESGLAAIKECSLMDEFNAHTGVCTDHQIIANAQGEVIYTDEGGVALRPEISRNSLTQLLLDQLPAETIKWEQKLHAASSSATGEVELDFGVHGKHTFDLVIGSDGTWSRVRKLLTPTAPKYAGVQILTVTIRHIASKYPELAKYVGSGTFSSLGHHHGVMSQRCLQDSARIYICISTTDENFASTSGFGDGTAADAKEKLLADDTLLGKFGPKIRELVGIACDEETKDNPGASLEIFPLQVLPIGHIWEHKSGATLIGDAAHVMSPWAAEGVNLAMWDALDLAHAIIAAHETAPTDALSFRAALDPLIKQFEEAMAIRAAEKAEETKSNGQVMFGSDDGATAMAKWFKAMMESRHEPGFTELN